MHRTWLLLAAAAASVIVLAGTAVAAERPNVIYIMADDLGYGDLGCYGQKQIRTPNLDKLADEGMKLTDYYAGCTVCRPSRLVLWTGRHTGHTPINSNASYVFKPEDVTVAELLHQAGYATGGVGKWAMGAPGSGGEPNRHGFDFWCGYLNQSEAHNYYPTHLYRCAGERVEELPLEGNVLMDVPRARGRVAEPEHRVTYSHDVMTTEALQFIRRNHRRPFLLHVHWTIPHANNEGGAVTGDGMEVPDYGIYQDKPWPSTAKGQAAMISRMDADVGRLVALLGELGIDRKTLILFTSDNGPHSEGGHKHEYFDANGPLRGFKRDLYEGGIRVPTLAWWPGVVAAGSQSGEPLAFYDFLPTACELAGVEAPQNIDGVSFLPTLLGKPDRQAHHEYLYWKFGNKEAVRMGQWKAVRLAPNRPSELYDLGRDVGETNDLADKQPEVVARMEQFMRQAVSP
ncbi:MAG: arylsulfatase [Pirellulales bacterium]|nr:arylsulfatase [Pirellulales bacterium]